MVNWTSIRITTPYNIGNIGEKKLEALTKQLLERKVQINAKVNAPDGSIVLLANNGQQNIVFAPNQITYISSILSNDINYQAIKYDFQQILDALLIDDALQYVINLEGSSQTNNSHEESIQVFENKLGDLPQEVYGVGYRFLIKDLDFNGEFKIEPMINNAGLYYYQFILNSIQVSNINSVMEAVKNEIEKNYDCKLNFVKEN